MLRILSLIYIEMDTLNFIESIVSDRMYFNMSLINRCYFICNEKYILSEIELEKMKKNIEKMEKCVVVEDEDVPEDIMDPLTCSAICLPVKLVTSGVTVDRSTFELLLLDGVDPFNRERLDESKGVVDEEMLRRIEEYNKRRRDSKDKE
ncbi:hypothetical protein LUQ84_002499 [Hamiltosporidium tvaerminnensis]|nr:hypothetical protein LUQ84_002499 [Hamiltosporidium tvaerminnensis]